MSSNVTAWRLSVGLSCFLFNTVSSDCVSELPWVFADFSSFHATQSSPYPTIFNRNTEAMSKKAFKSQASSSRAFSGAFGGDSAVFGSSAGVSAFGIVPSSPLSYVYEPPDLTGFSDPNVGVAFKNLQKKDGTTKAKALEDLQTYVSSLGAETGGVEEVMLTAWVGHPGRECTLGSQAFDALHRPRYTPAHLSIRLVAYASLLILYKDSWQSHVANEWQDTCLKLLLHG